MSAPTAEQLDALPGGAVVQDPIGRRWMRWWGGEGTGHRAGPWHAVGSEAITTSEALGQRGVTVVADPRDTALVAALREAAENLPRCGRFLNGVERRCGDPAGFIVWGGVLRARRHGAAVHGPPPHVGPVGANRPVRDLRPAPGAASVGWGGDGMTARCQWCGVFVANNTPRSRRVCRGYIDNILAWRWFDQLLCPSCSRTALTETGWNRPIGGTA